MNHMMGYGMGLSILIWTLVVVWFVVFTVLVLGKLNRIIELLERKS